MKRIVDVLSPPRGTKTVVNIPVTQDLGGLRVDVTVHVVQGRAPGPVLALISTLHSSEWLSIEMFRRLLARVSPEDAGNPAGDAGGKPGQPLLPDPVRAG